MTSPQGSSWNVAPHIGTGLPEAEGGFETPLGWFGVKWSVSNADGGSQEVELQIDTPEGTSGTVTAPPGTVVFSPEKQKRASTEMVLPGGKHTLTLRSND